MTRTRDALTEFAVDRQSLGPTWRRDAEGYLHTATTGSYVESARVRVTGPDSSGHP